MEKNREYLTLTNALQLYARRVVALPAHWSEPATEHQLTALNMLVGSGLSDDSREMRLNVIRKLIGLAELTSTKDLLKWEAGTLITFLKEWGTDWTLSEQGQFLIAETESRLSQAVESGPAQ